jgi:methionyl-tRNA formyltransferase
VYYKLGRQYRSDSSSPKNNEGEIILQREVAISPDDTAVILFSRLVSIGSELLVEVVSLLSKDEIIPSVKELYESSYYSYPTEDETRIKWDLYDADQICRLIRGLNPNPGAYFIYGS